MSPFFYFVTQLKFANITSQSKLLKNKQSDYPINLGYHHTDIAQAALLK